MGKAYIFRGRRGIFFIFLAGLTLLSPAFASAPDTVCARVKIGIKQELTLERPAFDTHMRITNMLSSITLDSVGGEVSFADAEENIIPASFDSDNPDALFSIRLDSILVQAGDPNETTPVLSATPLPAGVAFTDLTKFLLGSNPAAEDHSPNLPEITAPKGGAEFVLLQPDLVIENSTESGNKLKGSNLDIWRKIEENNLINNCHHFDLDDQRNRSGRHQWRPGYLLSF